MKRTVTLASLVLTLTLASLGLAGVAWSAPSTHVLDIAVRTAAADAEERSRTTTLTGSDLELGADRSTAQTVGLRFGGVSVPRGATITRAYVQFQTDEVSTARAKLTVAGQAADHAAAFTTASKNLSSRPRTSATVDWTPAAWPTTGARGADQRTPDLSPVVQQIVSRSGWVSGNALALLVTGTGTRTAESYEGGTAKAPVLHIEYGTGSGTASPSPASTPSASTPSASTPSASTSPASTSVGSGAAACASAGRAVVRPYAAGTRMAGPWEVRAPQNDATFDLTGVLSTAYPSTRYPFAAGTGTPAARTCIIGGELRGTLDPAGSWEHFHDDYNAACVKVVALEWAQIHGTRCDGIEDGFRPQEGGINLNRTQFLISGTYLSNIADDCLENDYTLGGVLRDNLWESCFTGISERPSDANGAWTSPAGETLTLDHMLIGLRSMPHDSGKGTGPNSLFKWSTSANRVVIKCSIFKVDARSVNGTDAMAIPPGTVIDDSACPNNPSTIVWLGGGNYPAPTAGLRVTNDPGVWTQAVTAWKTAHGY